MNIDQPPLSVVMPVHNALPFLDASIGSILNQSFSDFEFVILNDASTDGSDTVLRKWEKRDSRLRVIESPDKLGLAGSSNLIVSSSRARIIARMDADDISHPDRLIQQLDIMERHSDVVVVGTLCDGIDAAGQRTRPADRWRIVRRSRYIPFPHWANTRAFALPTDQHGWLRVNLIGREAGGTVPAANYEETCNDLETALNGLRSDRGEPLVDKVIRTARSVDDAMEQLLPDLVVNWSDAIFSSPLRIAGSSVEGEAIGKKYVAQHSLEGFCILRFASVVADSDSVRAEDLHLLIAQGIDSARASAAVNI